MGAKMFLKPVRYKNKKYTEYIKHQPCCITGRSNVDPHHTKSVGSGGSDLTQVPLIHELHQEVHKIGWRTFQEKYNIDFRDIRLKLLEQWIENGCKAIL
jgi:hypothetical protein